MSNKMETIITLFFAILLTTFAHAESLMENIIALSCNDGEYTKIIVLNTGKSDIEVYSVNYSYSERKSDPDGSELMEAIKNLKPGESITRPVCRFGHIFFSPPLLVLEPSKAICLAKVRSDLSNISFRLSIKGQLITLKIIDVDMTSIITDLTKEPSEANNHPQANQSTGEAIMPKQAK